MVGRQAMGVQGVSIGPALVLVANSVRSWVWGNACLRGAVARGTWRERRGRAWGRGCV